MGGVEVQLCYFFNLGVRYEWVVITWSDRLTTGMARTHSTAGRVVPGTVWRGVKILAHIGIRSPNRPARSQ